MTCNTARAEIAEKYSTPASSFARISEGIATKAVRDSTNENYSHRRGDDLNQTESPVDPLKGRQRMSDTHNQEMIETLSQARKFAAKEEDWLAVARLTKQIEEREEEEKAKLRDQQVREATATLHELLPDLPKRKQREVTSWMSDLVVRYSPQENCSIPQEMRGPGVPGCGGGEDD
jgi:hypothetical protein